MTKINYPAKTRSIKLAAPFPGKSGTVKVNELYPKGPSTRSASNEGKKPVKGILLTGGGHG